MASCDTCGNDYDKMMRVEYQGKLYQFDCFECAIHKLAPSCAHCGTQIIGHGVESDSMLYCCANCSRAEGQTDLRDRAA